jgi:hypothetical protein
LRILAGNLDSLGRSFDAGQVRAEADGLQ